MKITVRNQVNGHEQIIEQEDWNNEQKWPKWLKRSYVVVEQAPPSPTAEVQEVKAAETESTVHEEENGEA